MTQQKQSTKAQFIKLQNFLATQTKTEVTVYYLEQLINFFKEADLDNEKVMKNDVYDQLRDTVKSIFTYLDKVKVPNTDILKDIQKLIKEILLAICNFCSAYYYKYHPLGCGEMIKEFLSSQCRLFVPEYGAAAAPSMEVSSEQQKLEEIIEIEEKDWLWTKESTFKTLFFCDCIELIMRNLCKFEDKFQEMNIMVVGQFLRLLYYMDDYIVQDKLIDLCVKYVEKIEEIFKNPSKEIMKDANKQKLQEISDYMTKLLRYYKNDVLKKRIQLLGPLLGMMMMRMNSIEKKIVGCKIVSKFSYEMLYRSTSYITQTSYSQWIVGQKFFDLIFQDQNQASLIKSSQDTFKLLVKRGKLTKEQFQKFFEILEKADPELRRAMFKLIDPFRVDYHQIEAMLQIFKTARGTQFYDDQFFYFVEGLSRYSTQTQLTLMLSIVETIIKDHYSKLESYLTKRRSVQCYAYVFDRLVNYKDTGERIEAYCKVAEDFIKEPNQNKLIMLRTLFDNLSEHKMERSSQEILCDKIVIELKFIENTLKYATEVKFKDDLITTIKMILKKYGFSFNKQPFNQQTLLECVEFPEIFQEVLKLTKSSGTQELQKLFSDLCNLTAVKSFDFSCIKSVFIKMNIKCLRVIKKQYAEGIITNATIRNPEEFLGLDTLKYLIFNSQKTAVRHGACQLLVEVFTNFTDDFREEGELYLIQFMKGIINLLRHKLKQFFDNNISKTSMIGTLELVEDLMLNTEYFGVGSLKAHNSLIPTSTVNLKVYNNCTMGDDVLKIFEKKFPSNKTLYEVIVEVSKQFKIGPLDMCFEYPNNIMIKYNGLTLEELKLNGQEVNAIKAPQSRLKKEPLVIDGKLTPKSSKAFTDMFHKYAPSGKMAAKQCSDYIEGVTLSFCPLFDSRINSFFAEYDGDKDGILNLEDFLKFYQDCITEPDKLETVEKNLSNLRYRRDLKLFDDEFDSLNEQVLFRHHVWQNKDIYEDLFKLLYCEHLHLSSLSQTLLLRLPTNPKVIDSLNESFDFKEKNPFEVEYLLTALQSQIAQNQAFSKKLISSNNHLAIFEYLKELNQKEQKTINEKNCQIICFHLLRSLLFEGAKQDGPPQLIKVFPKLAFQLPKTDVFLSVIYESLKANDSTLLEPTFLLQLTQEKMQFDWLEEAAFHNDKDIRVITCGFLYTWMLKKTKDVDLFKVNIREENNEEWFNLLTLLVQVGIQIDYSEVFSDKIKELEGLTESLDGKRFNPLIEGNLKVINKLHNHLKEQQKNVLYKTLNKLLPSLISNENRELVYKMIATENSLELIDTLNSIADVKIGKEARPRNKFVGIRNLGCICYMNSILQQFFMIKQFHSLIMSLKPKQEETEINEVKVVDDFLYQLQQLYVYLELSQKQYYNPSIFCLAVKDFQGKPINTAIQEDAHQFLNTAFDKIENYTKDQEKVKILEQIFGGKTVTEIICQTCKNKKEVIQNYYHLTLEVKGMKNLKQSFDKWVQAEEIADYFCDNCDKTVEKITKQTLIKEAPEVLIINLQRIIFDLETFLKVKVHTKLQFDQVLDLHSYFSSSSQPAPYHLKGVVIHTGTSEAGHYYSLIKHESKWYKFNDQSVTFSSESNVGKEAFGGEQHYDTMVGDFTSSTNAYILFYERDKLNEECQISELKQIVNDRIREQVLQDNKQFEYQIQMYQPSYFTCVNTLFEEHVKEGSKETLQKFFELYLKIIKHLCINSDIKNQLISQIKDNFLRLCDLMPAKTLTIIDIFDKKQLGQIICTHNDVNIRQIYSKILIKSFLAYLNDSEQMPEKVDEMLDYMLGLLDESLVLKNIYKSYQYFDMWKELISNKKIKIKMLKMDIFGKLIDLLMGSESIFSTKDKKRAEFNMSEAMPLVPIIIALIQHKNNLESQHPLRQNVEQFLQSTDLESRVINNPNFYKKMMKNKLDMGLLVPIISLYSFKDDKYSKFIAQVLLKSLNSVDEIEDKNIVFVNIKAFLMVDDEYTLDRMKWILGVSQLDSISFTDQVFGMMNSPESKVISYVSSLFFVKDEKYSPLLFSLFDKRKYFNAFVCFGICMLLELLNESAIAREYLLSLPAPTYIQKTYLDWIETFTIKIKTEDHYGLPIDKHILSQKLNKLLEEYHKKIQQNPLSKDLPINKKIIGKNVEVIQKQTLKTENYQIDMWAHETYVLDNRPFSLGNLQLPDDEFSFNSTTDTPKARCFLKSLDLQSSMEQEAPDIKKEWTVLTFNIKNSVNMVLSFNVNQFRHRIYLKNGDHSVNCPFVEGEIYTIVQVEEMIEEKKQESLTAPASSEHNSNYLPEIIEEPKMMDFDNMAFGIMEVNCKTCTYLNIGRDTCEMCGTDLK